MKLPIALTIAGSDSSGGAGIQADLKTFSALGVYGTSAITALTAQNTQGVNAIEAPTPAFVASQIEAVLEDMDVGAAKTGMLYAADTVLAVVEVLKKRPNLPLIVDPVMVSTSGHTLLQEDAIEAIKTALFPLAEVMTPNLPEAALLTGQPVAKNLEEMQAQAEILLEFGPKAVLIKGGHGATDEATDLLITPSTVEAFSAPRIETRNTHGTGCTLSAAIAAHRAKGLSLPQSIKAAKAYLTKALEAGSALTLGKGSGPTHHFYDFWR